VLAPAGYSLLVADTQGPGAEARVLRTLDRSRADGLVVFDGSLPPEDLAAERRGAALPPVILACEWIDALTLPTIRVDNEAGARLAVAHLAALGHRSIGHVLGPEGNVLTAARARGTRAALAERGLDVREDWFLPGDFSLESGRRAARTWLGLPDRPSAVFCASDEMACGFIGEVQRCGLRVPGDVSVAGFDDIEVIAHITPALTTIRQPRSEIGEAAARGMLDLIAGAEERREIVLPVELIVRDSTAPLGVTG
jgi:LacI family repressor for deo operon, udp, cdd, tsx, nupC, and nupG